MSADEASPSHGGIHLSRGVAIRIPVGGLTIGFDERGQFGAQLKEVHLQLNTCTDWLEIALDHLHTAHSSHAELLKQHAGNGDLASSMQQEFKSSMQACVASATFFEALYALARDCMPPRRLAPKSKGRAPSSRADHVTEQLKRSFGLRQKGTSNLRSVLVEIYRFRDEAVHPAASFGPPARHPALGLVVERRFAMYTASNAHLLVRAALAYCEILPTVAGKQGPKEGRNLCNYLLNSGSPLFAAWRAQYGKLRDDEAAA